MAKKSLQQMKETISIAEVLLTHYHELRNDPTEENIIHVMNIHGAFRAAPLTDNERELLKLRYFAEPVPPERDKPDKNGGTNGRPAGGWTDETVARLMYDNVSINAAKGRFKRTKNSALKKFQETLGYTKEDYA